MFWQTAEVA